MAENNSSATLLPCPFCGAAARMKPSTRGDYTSIVCNSPCAGPLAIVVPNDQIEAGIAAWNTRAPQAVAAQAPAAVAVPDERAEFERWARWCCYDITRDGGNAQYDSNTTEQVWIAWKHRASLATPALPATGHSSAGDLAAVHADDVAVDALAAKMKAKLAKQRAKGYGGWDTRECSQQRLSAMLREHVAKGDPVDVANFCAFLAARGEGIAAAVQAEPAAWINHPVIVDGSGNFAGYGKPELSFKRPAYGYALDKAQALYTAPQAQPADALDAARLDFLETQKRREARDGGYSAFYSVHLPAMAAGPWQATHGGEYDHKTLRESIDAAMAAAQEGGNAAKEA